jgi:hypothetical protein
MNDATATETAEVVVHVDRALRDRRTVVITVSPDFVEITVHPDVPVDAVNCLRDELADVVETAVLAFPQSPNGMS